MGTTVAEAQPRGATQAPTPIEDSPRADMPGLYRLSVEQYHRMAEAGVLKDSDRVELIEGLLVRKMTKNERHLTTSWRILYALIRGLPAGWIAVPESPLVLGQSAEYALRQSLVISMGSPAIFFTRPICIVLFATALLCLLYPLVRDRLRGLEEAE